MEKAILKKKSPHRGVSWRGDKQKYYAKIYKNGEHIHLGSYKNEQAAIDARLKAEEQMEIDNNKYKSEDQHQAAVVKWFWNKHKEFRGLLYHNFNNPRNRIQGAQLVALGLMKGNPDLTLALPRGGFAALYLEMKKPGQKPRPEQVKQMDRLKSAGNKVEWADNAEAAVEIIEKYLSL